MSVCVGNCVYCLYNLEAKLLFIGKTFSCETYCEYKEWKRELEKIRGEKEISKRKERDQWKERKRKGE